MTATHLVYREASLSKLYPPVNKALLGLTCIEISPTELCNRTCSFCPRHDPKLYPNLNLNMTIDTAMVLKHQLDQSKFEGYVSFSGYGEPTLNPNFLKICKVFADYPIEIITNGDNILKGKISVDELLTAGAHEILVSDYDRNPDWKIFTDKYSQMIVRDHYDDGSNKYEEYNFNNRGGKMWDIEHPVKRACFIPSYKVAIDWNGDVILCSQNWLVKKVMGNIHSNTLTEVWMGEEFTTIRKSLIQGHRRHVPSCRNCDVKGDVFGKQQSMLWT